MILIQQSGQWTDPMTLLTGGIVLCMLLQAFILLNQVRLQRDEQRAWLGPASVATVNGLRHKDGMGADVLLTNTGNTPALDFRLTFSMRCRPFNEEFSPVYGEPTHRSCAVVYPHGSTHCLIGMKLTPNEANAVEKGTKKLYVYGSLNYQDVFRKKRQSKFAASYDHNGGSWSFLHTYNEAT